MEALKQKRATLRSAFTRSTNSLDVLLTAAQAKAADIEVIYEQLFERFKNLKDCDIRILDLLQKEKCTQEDYDKEYNACELYEDKFITYKIKVKNILAGKAQGADVQRFTDPGTKFKLPNIELPTFDGNPRDWLNFWTRFEKIHDDVNIDDRDKFQYLIQSTAPRSSPREIVESFPILWQLTTKRQQNI
ncbi:integrase catalytic domain-containing protein [Trichonephila inaurata madagascariensis]|uniref:Integrase catalytic domain-containing protein n=1 Tax=Trichonephila inaurata madagascariensis TaxID=2747483 RepID=A0A8X6WRH4_9ARAC|nr:integrase catalytic domain-containing protein [Trichonephila inaurata madagascariensis]